MTGLELKEIRKGVFGLTQENFGKLIGKSLSVIHYWEKGQRSIPKLMEDYILRLTEQETKAKAQKYDISGENKVVQTENIA